MEWKEETIDGKKYFWIREQRFEVNVEGVDIPSDQIPDVQCNDLPGGTHLYIHDDDLEVVFFGGQESEPYSIVIRIYLRDRDQGHEVSTGTFDNMLDLSSAIRRENANIMSIENTEIGEDDAFASFEARVQGKTLAEIFHRARTLIDDVLKPIREVEAMIEEKGEELRRKANDDSESGDAQPERK